MEVQDISDISTEKSKLVHVHFEGELYKFRATVWTNGVATFVKDIFAIDFTYKELKTSQKKKIRKAIKLYFESCNSENNS